MIGFDCGASHTSVSVWQNGKLLLHKNDLPGVNLDIVGPGDASDRLMPTVKELAKYKGAKWVVGMAGLDNAEELKDADSWLKEFLGMAEIAYTSCKVLSDIDLVLWSGSDNGYGIGLIAGTGSNCVGKNKFGETFKTGGMSHILSDEGAGFSLGWKCLHLITKMNDGRVLKTSLIDDVMKLYGCSNIVELKNFLVGTESMKVTVANCAEALLAAADRNEEEAMKICAEESLELVRMVMAVNAGLRSDEVLPVFLAGSLFRNKNYLELFKTGLSKYSPGQKIKLVSPIDGALVFGNTSP